MMDNSIEDGEQLPLFSDQRTLRDDMHAIIAEIRALLGDLKKEAGWFPA